MPLMTWTEKLSVGVGASDEDHRRLIGLINALFGAMTEGQSKAVLGDIIAGLVRYTERHFAREEKLLDETGYPAATQHRRQHEALTYQVLEVQREFAAGTSATISADVLRFLRHWLLDHISLDDKKYGPHLNALEIH